MISSNEQTLAQVNWRAFAESLGFAGSITDTPLAIYLRVLDAEAQDPLLWAGIAMTFDMVSIAILGVTWATSSAPMVVIAEVTGAVALMLSLQSYRTSGGTSILSDLDIGLSGIIVGAALYDATAVL